jgi:DNA-binding LytR/AlgR family response regulator
VTDRPAPAPRAVIADDEPLLRDALAAALAIAWPELRIVASCGDGDAALEAIRRERPDVAFLDIRMPGRSGLQVAHDAAETLDAPLYVFVTAHDEHAVEAFDREAVDYLLKPVREDRLARTVGRLRARLAELAAPSSRPTTAPATGVAEFRRLMARLIDPPAPPEPLGWLRARFGPESRMVPIGQVLAFEAGDAGTRVLTPDETGWADIAPAELAVRLPPGEFWQIDEGVFVRAREIVRTTTTLSGGMVVHLRARRASFRVSPAFAHPFRDD